MKFTWNWLKDHLETSADMATILEALTMLGLELDSVTDRAEALGPFTIARITAAEPHPNADTLKVCRVDTGKGKAEVEVVCGAPNAREGLVGVFAPVGAHVPGIDLTLTEAEIRGVKSRGMMCSEREMMISDEHDGIIELDGDAPLGGSFAGWAGLDDPVIEIEITPNRADCLGVRGIARDLAAAGHGKLKPLKQAKVASRGKSRVNWRIDLPKGREQLVPRIAGRSFTGVANGRSPRWMRQRLEAVGQRPISALVDITNYVMIDIGRPLHAYDIDRIKGDTLTLRLARDGETFEALNEKTYKLDDTMLVIADADGADDLAGIMGGQRSGVSESTTGMFLEMAVFDPANVAATGRKLNINSDARYRFERGLDVTSPDRLMDHASALVLEICGGEASEAVVEGPGAKWERSIAFEPKRVAALTGVDVSAARQKKILQALGFEVKAPAKSKAWKVSPPPWRGDIDGAADLVEEVIRVAGFDTIPETALPDASVVGPPAVDAAQKRPHTLKRMLAGRGLMEAVTFSFIDLATARRFGGGGEALRLVNPISTDLDTMRPSIIPNLLAAAGRNAARGESDSALFEVGPVFPGDGPDDQRTVAAGLRHGMAAPRNWQGTSRAVDWSDAKADALAVLAALGIAADSLQSAAEAPGWYHPGRSGVLRRGSDVLARFGAVHPSVLERFDLRGPAAAFEVVLEDVGLPKAKGPARPLAELSAFQPVQRDFAFILDESVSAEKLLRAIRGAGKPLVSDAAVFDSYAGEGIAKGSKSVAVAVTLQPQKATLREEEIESVSDSIVQAVAKHCGGELRS